VATRFYFLTTKYIEHNPVGKITKKTV